MPVGNFAIADVVMGIVIIVSAAFGLMRGLAREVLSLVIWVAALLLGIAFADSVAGVLGLDLSVGLQTAIGFAIVFVAVLVGGALAQRFLGGLVESTGLTGTDRTLGLVFGTVRGAAVVLVALILLRPFAESRDWWSESRIAPPLLTFENEVMELFDLVMDSVSGPAEPQPVGLDAGVSTAFAPRAGPHPVASMKQTRRLLPGGWRRLAAGRFRAAKSRGDREAVASRSQPAGFREVGKCAV